MPLEVAVASLVIALVVSSTTATRRSFTRWWRCGSALENWLALTLSFSCTGCTGVARAVRGKRSRI
jgi:hypothetical protein